MGLCARLILASIFISGLVVMSVFSRPLRKYKNRNRKLDWIVSRSDVPLAHVTRYPRSKLKAFVNVDIIDSADVSPDALNKKWPKERIIRDIHVDSKTIDNTLKTLNMILDEVKDDETEFPQLSSDVNNVDSKTIDKTLNKLETILGTVDDVTVRMDTYVEGPTPKSSSNTGSHDTGGVAAAEKVSPKPGVSDTPKKVESTDVIVVDTDLLESAGVTEKEEVTSNSQPEVIGDEVKVKAGFPLTKGSISVDIPGYNSNLYGRHHNPHERLHNNRVFFAIDEGGGKQNAEAHAHPVVVDPGMNVLSTPPTRGLAYFHKTSDSENFLKQFAHHEVTILCLLVLVIVKGFIGLALYSKCRDIKERNKMRVVGVNSESELAQPKVKGIMGVAEKVTTYAFHMGDKVPALKVFDESSDEEKGVMSKMKKLFTVKKKGDKKSKKDEKPGKRTKVPPSPRKKGFLSKKAKSPKKPPSPGKKPPPPGKKSAAPPPKKKSPTPPPSPKKKSPTPPPSPKKKSPTPPPPPGKKKATPPPPPGKKRATPPSPPKDKKKATPPPPPKDKKKATPPPPPKDKKKAPPPPKDKKKAPPPPPKDKKKATPPPPPKDKKKTKPPPPPKDKKKATPPPPLTDTTTAPPPPPPPPSQGYSRPVRLQTLMQSVGGFTAKAKAPPPPPPRAVPESTRTPQPAGYQRPPGVPPPPPT